MKLQILYSLHNIMMFNIPRRHIRRLITLGIVPIAIRLEHLVELHPLFPCNCSSSQAVTWPPPILLSLSCCQIPTPGPPVTGSGLTGLGDYHVQGYFL